MSKTDGLFGKDAQAYCGRLSNSAILATLSSHLSYLSENQGNDIVELFVYDIEVCFTG